MSIVTDGGRSGLGDQIDADWFQGPPRLRPLIPVLRKVPAGMSEGVLALLAIGDGLVRGRFRRASAWAHAQGASTPWSSRRMAIALLANHGRFVAEEALLGVHSSAELSRGVSLHGGEQLADGRGALLLGFHLGPPKTWLRLRALGYPVRFAGRLESLAHDPRWDSAIASGAVIRLPDGDPQARLLGLMRMRELLRGGAIVYVTADGPYGREAFQIELPGGPLTIRGGWLALRRAAGVQTLPVLTHREGQRRVIVIYPPLPPVDPDPARDAAQCRQALAPLIADYVRRFPTQCRWIAMPPWRSGPGDTGA